MRGRGRRSPIRRGTATRGRSRRDLGYDRQVRQGAPVQRLERPRQRARRRLAAPHQRHDPGGVGQPLDASQRLARRDLQGQRQLLPRGDLDNASKPDAGLIAGGSFADALRHRRPDREHLDPPDRDLRRRHPAPVRQRRHRSSQRRRAPAASPPPPTRCRSAATASTASTSRGPSTRSASTTPPSRPAADPNRHEPPRSAAAPDSRRHRPARDAHRRPRSRPSQHRPLTWARRHRQRRRHRLPGSNAAAARAAPPSPRSPPPTGTATTLQRHRHQPPPPPTATASAATDAAAQRSAPTPTPPPPPHRPPDTHTADPTRHAQRRPRPASQINLRWTAATDNVGVTGYLVERCQGAGCTHLHPDRARPAAHHLQRHRPQPPAPPTATGSAPPTPPATSAPTPTSPPPPPRAPDTTPPTEPGTLTATAVSAAGQPHLGRRHRQRRRHRLPGRTLPGAGCTSFAQVGRHGSQPPPTATPA